MVLDADTSSGGGGDFLFLERGEEEKRGGDTGGGGGTREVDCWLGCSGKKLVMYLPSYFGTLAGPSTVRAFLFAFLSRGSGIGWEQIAVEGNG